MFERAGFGQLRPGKGLGRSLWRRELEPRQKTAGV